jgi:hypothetical protein
MPTFPRTVLPAEVGWPAFPTGLRAYGETGKVQLRSTQQVGRMWEERYPPLKLSDLTVRAWLAQVEDYWRNQTVLDVDHRSLRTLLGSGGGTPVVSTPAAVNISSSNNDTILVTTSSAHGFAVGDEVEIASHTRTPSINGLHTVATVPLTTTLTIPSILAAFSSGGGATGTVRKRATGASLATSGWPNNTLVLRAGDVFRIAGLNIVFTATADVTSDGSGLATIPLNPPLYGGGLSAAGGSALTLNATPGTVKFRAIIDQMSAPRGMGPEIYAGLLLAFREIP